MFIYGFPGVFCSNCAPEHSAPCANIARAPLGSNQSMADAPSAELCLRFAMGFVTVDFALTAGLAGATLAADSASAAAGGRGIERDFEVVAPGPPTPPPSFNASMSANECSRDTATMLTHSLSLLSQVPLIITLPPRPQPAAAAGPPQLIRSHGFKITWIQSYTQSPIAGRKGKTAQHTRDQNPVSSARAYVPRHHTASYDCRDTKAHHATPRYEREQLVQRTRASFSAAAATPRPHIISLHATHTTRPPFDYRCCFFESIAFAVYVEAFASAGRENACRRNSSTPFVVCHRNSSTPFVVLCGL